MQTLKIGEVEIPSSSDVPVAPNPVDTEIEFGRFVDPFVKLLATVGALTIFPVVFAADIALSILSDAYVVFSRIFNPAPFNPTDASFVKMIEDLEKQIPLHQKNVDELNLLFKQEERINRDIHKLKQVKDEINERLSQLGNYLFVMKDRENPLPIVGDIKRVEAGYEKVRENFDLFCFQESKAIVGNFFNVVDLVTRGGVVPRENIRQELIETWDALNSTIQAHHFDEGSSIETKFREIRSRINSFEESHQAAQSAGLNTPLKLRNSGGTSCYMDSVLQAFFCIDQICEKLSRPLELDDVSDNEEDLLKKSGDSDKIREAKKALYLKKIPIREELVKFLEAPKKSRAEDYTELEYILFLLRGSSGPSNKRLREKIFESGLHGEFYNEVIGRQLDAASMVEFFIANFIPKFMPKLQEYVSAVDFPGLEFDGRMEDTGTLQIPLVKDGEVKSKAEFEEFRKKKFNQADQQVEHLIHLFMDKHANVETVAPFRKFQFDPERGKVVNQEEAAPILDEAMAREKEIAAYTQWYRLKNAPPVLTLHFKRFLNVLQSEKIVNGKTNKSFERKKIDRPVILPEDGIVDLSNYYDAPEGVSRNARYKIKSFVVHNGGTIEGGHYVTYVEIKGEYYFCDDTDPQFYRKISKEEFFRQRNAYLVVLEKMPEEELVAVAESVPVEESPVQQQNEQLSDLEIEAKG